jgi:hypothetical protein
LPKGLLLKRGLIIAPKLDIHAFAVRHAAMEMGEDIAIINSAEFTTEFDLCVKLLPTIARAYLPLIDGSELDLDSISGLWWRRPEIPNVGHLGNVDFATVREMECSEAIFGALEAFVPNAFNTLASSRSAGRKIVQLNQAKKRGFRIPNTMVTNSPELARAFCESQAGEIIYKIFRSPSTGFFPTRTMVSGDMPDLDTLKHCPCIFQERICGIFDLRITIVGDDIFAAKVDLDQYPDLIDTRALTTGWENYQLPASVSHMLLELVRSHGLVYCTVDMRVTPAGDYVFFEINPEGQYLWTEIEADIPISRAIAKRIVAVS